MSNTHLTFLTRQKSYPTGRKN